MSLLLFCNQACTFHLICVELLLCYTNKPPEETTANNELALDCWLAQQSMNRARCVAAAQKSDEQSVRHRRQEGCVFCPWGQSSARLSTTCDTEGLQPNLKTFIPWLSDGNLPGHFYCKLEHGANKKASTEPKRRFSERNRICFKGPMLYPPWDLFFFFIWDSSGVTKETKIRGSKGMEPIPGRGCWQ